MLRLTPLIARSTTLLVVALGTAAAWAQNNTYPWPQTGSIGIGTPSPTAQLEVVGNVKASDYIATSGANGGYWFVDRTLNPHSWIWYAYNDVARLYNGSDRFAVTYSGNVGIGSTAPTSALEVQSANTLVGNGVGIGGVYFGTTVPSGADKGGVLLLGGANGSASKVVFGSVAGRKENASLGDCAGYLQFATNNAGGSMSEKMRISSIGNVGIGTSGDPSAKLHVVGDIKLSGDLNVSGGASATKSYNLSNFGLAAGYSAPQAGRLLFGDGSGWKLSIASGTAQYPSDLVTIRDYGWVGIGTSEPLGPLHVKLPERRRAVAPGQQSE